MATYQLLIRAALAHFGKNTKNKQKKNNNNKTTNAAKQQKSENQKLLRAMRQVLRLGLPAAGGAIGGYFGGQPGFKYGTGIGSLASQLIGSGDYTVSSNTVNLPTFKQDRSLRLRHREYIGDILTSATAGGFNLENYLINPGNTLLFPWLSGISQSFQQYRIHGMVFMFNSTSSDALNSTNTALGTLVMATNYDSNEAVYTSKQEMENSFFSNATRPSASALHPIECQPSQTTGGAVKLIAHGGEEVGDYPNYHWGNFQIATVGFQGTNVNIGELWVSYDIELIKPKASDIPYYYYYGYSTTSTYSGPLTGMTADTSVDHTNNLSITTTGTTIVFPTFKKTRHFLVQNYFVKTAGAITGSLFQPSGGSGLDVQSGANYNGASAQYGPTYNVTAALDATTSIAINTFVKCLPNYPAAADRTITYSVPSAWTGAFSLSQLRIIELSSAYANWPA